jgi:hypothetical protein
MSLPSHERQPIGVNLTACAAAAVIAMFPTHPIVIAIAGLVVVVVLGALISAVAMGDRPQAVALPLTLYVVVAVVLQDVTESTHLEAIVLFLAVAATFGISVASLILFDRRPVIVAGAALVTGLFGALADRAAFAFTPMGAIFVPFNQVVRGNPLHWSIFEGSVSPGSSLHLAYDVLKILLLAGWDTVLTTLSVAAVGLLICLPVRRLTEAY